MVVLHAVGPEPGGGALRAMVTQTPTVVRAQSSTRKQARLRGMTIAAQSARSRLDNFAHAQHSGPAANAREASRTFMRSWLTPQLPQRLPNALLHDGEQSSAAAKEFAHGVSQLRSTAAASARCYGWLHVLREDGSPRRCVQARWQPVGNLYFHRVSMPWPKPTIAARAAWHA